MATDKFQYQDIMVFTKKIIPLGQHRSLSYRSTHKIDPQAKRANSLKPTRSERDKRSAFPSNLLPPIKSLNLKDRGKHSPIEQQQKSSNPLMGQRPKQIRPRYSKQISFSNSKNCLALSPEQLIQRRQSHQNTYYNLRKNRLVQITKENRQIYSRINSQKSLYCSQELDRSYESNCSLSRRLSQSKLSKISSRHSIQRGRVTPKCEEKMVMPLQHNPNKFQCNEIDKRETQKVYRYMSIFCNRMNLKQNQAGKQSNQLPIICKQEKFNKENHRNSPISSLQRSNDAPSKDKNRRNTIILARLL